MLRLLFWVLGAGLAAAAATGAAVDYVGKPHPICLAYRHRVEIVIGDLVSRPAEACRAWGWR